MRRASDSTTAAPCPAPSHPRCSFSIRLATLAATLLSVAGCVLDGTLKREYTAVPSQLQDGWTIGTPEAAGLSPDSLAKIYATLHSSSDYLNALGLLIAVDGKLVWETYVRTPKDRDTYHHLQSTTKSVTSLATGIAVDSGWITGLDSTFCSIVPESCPTGGDPRRSITLRHLLTMRSGISFDNDDFSMEMYTDKPADPLRYILSKPMYAAPGARFYYRDADPHLMGAALRRLSGRDEQEIVEQALFAPMGIRDYYWDRAPGGQPMAAHGLHLKPRDLLKLAQLGLDSGAWNGQQLVSRAWMRESMAFQSVTTHHEFEYGFYWWRIPAIGATSTWGHCGQFAFFWPEKRLAVALVSLPDTDDDVVGTQLGKFLALIAPILAR